MKNFHGRLYDGTRLQRIRETMGLRVYVFADVLGIDRATLYRWESKDTFSTQAEMPSAILAWLFGLADEKLLQVGIGLENLLKRKNLALCRDWLYRQTVVDGARPTSQSRGA